MESRPWTGQSPPETSSGPQAGTAHEVEAAELVSSAASQTTGPRRWMPAVIARASADWWRLCKLSRPRPARASVRNFRFDQPHQMVQRFLPAEVTHLGGDRGGNALLHDVELRATADRAQRDRRDHLA